MAGMTIEYSPSKQRLRLRNDSFVVSIPTHGDSDTKLYITAPPPSNRQKARAESRSSFFQHNGRQSASMAYKQSPGQPFSQNRLYQLEEVVEHCLGRIESLYAAWIARGKRSRLRKAANRGEAGMPTNGKQPDDDKQQQQQQQQWAVGESAVEETLPGVTNEQEGYKIKEEEDRERAFIENAGREHASSASAGEHRAPVRQSSARISPVFSYSGGSAVSSWVTFGPDLGSTSIDPPELIGRVKRRWPGALVYWDILDHGDRTATGLPDRIVRMIRGKLDRLFTFVPEYGPIPLLEIFQRALLDNRVAYECWSGSVAQVLLGEDVALPRLWRQIRWRNFETSSWIRMADRLITLSADEKTKRSLA